MLTETAGRPAHIFVHVVRSRQDHFRGIKQRLRRQGDVEIIDVSLTESEFDIVDSVEYSRRKLLRFAYYRPLFRALEQRLRQTLAERSGARPTVYFADEGVWALIWDRVRAALPGETNAVCVQHGFATLSPARFIPLRKVLNAVATAFTGFPFLGLGSLGGAGAGPFDLYLTYDEETVAIAASRTGKRAVAAPHIIKADLIEGFAAIRREPGKPRVLFAMQPWIKGSRIKCGSVGTFDALLEMARQIQAAGGMLAIRLHPGMDRAIEAARFAAHPIAAVAELDDRLTLHESFADASIVMSFYSTVLWEAHLLGILAVQVQCDCCETLALPYPVEELDLSRPFEQRLADLLAVEVPAGVREARLAQDAEWAVVGALIAAAKQ